MSRQPLMPEVLDGLTAALERSRPRRRRFLPHGLGLGIAVVLVSGTAVAAVSPWNPFGMDRDRYTLEAPPADQTAALAVLRREQDNRDRGPLMTAFLTRFGTGEPARVRLRYVRYLRDVEAVSMVGHDGRMDREVRPGMLLLIPQERGGVRVDGPAGKIVPHELCMVSVYDTWPTERPIPRSIQLSFRPKGAPAPPWPRNLADRVSGGGTCASAHQIRMKGLMSGAFNDGGITGIVPDGVALVRARTRDGQTVESRVVNNSFQLLAPGRNEPAVGSSGADRMDLPPMSGQFRHQSLEWVDASGAVIRRLPQ